MRTLSLVLALSALIAGCDQGPFDDAFWDSEVEVPELPSRYFGADDYCLSNVLLAYVEWLPNGKGIVFDYLDEEGSLWFVDSRGRRLEEIVAPDLVPNTHADIFTDGSKVVYSTCRFENPYLVDMKWPFNEWGPFTSHGHEIAISTLDGRKTRRLTADGIYDNYPVLSPDNDEVAFLSRLASSTPIRLSELNIMKIDGTDRRSIPMPDRSLYFDTVPPMWSPNGTKLAFVADRALYMADVESAEVRRLMPVSGGPAWSLDEGRIALSRKRDDDVALYSVGPDGSGLRLIAKITDLTSFKDPEGRYFIHRPYHIPKFPKWSIPPVGPWIHTLSWSPDETMILFSCDQGVCIVDTNGNSVGDSSSDLYGLDRPVAAWSPDGSRIAVKRRASAEPLKGNVVLYTMDPDGSDVRVLVRDGPDGEPVAQAGY